MKMNFLQSIGLCINLWNLLCTELSTFRAACSLSTLKSAIISTMEDKLIGGHPFMTSTRRGRGFRLRLTVGGRGQDSCGPPHRKLKIESMWTSTRGEGGPAHADRETRFFWD